MNNTERLLGEILATLKELLILTLEAQLEEWDSEECDTGLLGEALDGIYSMDPDIPLYETVKEWWLA